MRAWAVAMLLVSTAAVPASTQERGPETLVPETLAPETLGPASEAWNLERAFVEMERLQAEVAVLKGIAAAQAALLAWNRERAETLGPDSGAGPAALSARLCAEPALAIWCRALPATFGADAVGPADDEHGKDGER